MSQNPTNSTQKGFTLVELAIVLVIIGLIVSSVLVGQDLIKAAQLRATVRQLNEIQVGVNTFIGKYTGVPGDILAANATNFGLTGAGGDGNGVITDTSGAATIAAYSFEISSFWGHLTTEGKELIPGTFLGTCTTACTTGVDFPVMKFGVGGWGAYGNSTTGVNYFVAGMASPSTAGATTTANVLLPIDAQNIDSKIDDGLPNTGDVMAGSAGATFVNTLAPTTTANTGCVSATTDAGLYTSTATAAACYLRFKMQTF